jgi:hypothetical protein
MSFLDPKTLSLEYRKAEEDNLQAEQLRLKKLQQDRDDKFVLQVGLVLSQKEVWIRGSEENKFAEHVRKPENGTIHIDRSGVSSRIVDESIEVARSKGWIVWNDLYYMSEKGMVNALAISLPRP